MGLEKLLYLQGVAAEFIDCHGAHIQIPEEDRVNILACMLAPHEPHKCEPAMVRSHQLQSSPWIEQRNYLLDAKPWTQLLPVFQHCDINQLILEVYLPQTYRQVLNIKLQLECGECYQFSCTPHSNEHCEVIGNYHIGADVYLHYRLTISAALMGVELPRIGLGYHEVTVELVEPDTLGAIPEASLTQALTESSTQQATASWLVAPNETYQGAGSLKQASKAWGGSIQLYSLRTESQWGIGDFGDLMQLIDMLAKQGGAFILLNPLHALDIANPDEASPYSPDDRRRLNPLYINIEQVPEFEQLKVDQLLTVLNRGYGASQADRQSTTDANKPFASLDALKRVLNQSNWLNYQDISHYKYIVYQQLYQAFCQQHLDVNTPRARLFKQFVSEQGAALNPFCQHQSAAQKCNRDEPQFFAYLQFIAEQQLAQCQLHAKQLQMSIGLVRDLAVGVSADSCEVASQPELFCTHASIGAPPDEFAPQGQNWGLTPFDPIALKSTGYQHFIDLLRSNMRSCGALRIDHVMSLLRLWWWPKDSELGGGAYVYYPQDCLIAILCIESQRARCQIIGEDLGLIPPEIVCRLQAAGVMSNQLFYFNKQDDQFTPPADYKRRCLMMLANHDVPTLKAWWQGSDLYLRRSLELIDSDEALKFAQDERAKNKLQLLNLLINQGAMSSQCKLHEIDYPQLLQAWIKVSAAGNAELFSVQLCDLTLERLSVNVPGTWQQYPNWQRRLPKTLAEIAKDDRVQHLMQQVSAGRMAGFAANTKDAVQHSSSDTGSELCRDKTFESTSSSISEYSNHTNTDNLL
ncbi:4-alpha-glucanotransferase [Shewanella sp. 125m-7]